MKRTMVFSAMLAVSLALGLQVARAESPAAPAAAPMSPATLAQRIAGGSEVSLMPGLDRCYICDSFGRCYLVPC